MLLKLIVSIGITDTRKERLREMKIRQRLEGVQEPSRGDRIWKVIALKKTFDLDWSTACRDMEIGQVFDYFAFYRTVLHLCPS